MIQHRINKKQNKIKPHRHDLREIEDHLLISEGMGFFLVDKKECLVIETKDDTKRDSYNAVDSSICSNSESIVHSYASVIEVLA
jgi:hypothetical protein